MENVVVMKKNVSRSNNLDECDLRDTSDEISSTLIYGKALEPPILGRFYREPDILKKYIEPTVLDTSLPYIPVYTHLKTYDLKAIVRPTTPPILSELKLKCLGDAESCKSSKAATSTGRISKGRSSISFKPRESERSFKIE